MKKLLMLLLLPLLLLTSCSSENIYIASIITTKWDRRWVQVIRSGKVTITVPHRDYYFQFNERKPYVKKVTGGDYDQFNVGDIYSFQISVRETECFFEESIVRLKETSSYESNND